MSHQQSSLAIDEALELLENPGIIEEFLLFQPQEPKMNKKVSLHESYAKTTHVQGDLTVSF